MIGSKIKSIREAQQITKEELAERSQISVTEIEQIEQDKIMPSLAPLIKIARTLGVRIGTFLDDQLENGPAIARANSRAEHISFSNNATNAGAHMAYYTLAGAKAGRHTEPFLIELQSMDKTSYERSSHEGEEFIYVLEGEVEIVYGMNTYLLAKGDSIYYDSIVEHHVHAACNQPAKVIAVVYTPL